MVSRDSDIEGAQVRGTVNLRRLGIEVKVVGPKDYAETTSIGFLEKEHCEDENVFNGREITPDMFLGRAEKAVKDYDRVLC